MISKQRKNAKRQTVKLRGVVTSGKGESRLFTEIPWVRKQFIEKLSIDPHPGTLNIAVLDDDREKLLMVRQSRGIEIIPEDADFCTASSFPVLVNGKIKGAAIIPLVPDYPQAQLEIISSRNIKQSLSLKDRDLVEVEVYL